MSTHLRACALVCLGWLAFTVTPALAQAPAQPAAPGPAAASSYPSAEAAATALVDAIAGNDPAALRSVLGSDYRRVITLQDVSPTDKLNFLAAWAQSHRLVPRGDSSATLEVGTDAWPLPVPIVKGRSGWSFDTAAGADEIRARRIGRNELSAMQAALAYVEAQREYAAQDRNGDGVLEYARRLLSTPGQRDGLYWEAADGEPPSPLGPAFGRSAKDGAYLGYRFRILQAQGANAQGGARDYRIGGRLAAGFALVAWPARWGETGVTSFIVNHRGVVYEKNLGPRTAERAAAIQRFDPDAGWKAVDPDRALIGASP